MQMPDYNELEAWIVKTTYKVIFLGVTVLFLVKVGGLLILTFEIKRAALLAYLNSGQAVTYLGKALWNIIKEAVKGGITP